MRKGSSCTVWGVGVSIKEGRRGVVGLVTSCGGGGEGV